MALTTAMTDIPLQTIRQHQIPTAVLSDTLDSLGLRNQAMQPQIRPLDLSTDMAGRARTGLYMPVYHVEPGVNPYEWEIRLVDDRPAEHLRDDHRERRLYR